MTVITSQHIHQLDPLLANQIAAGEVVERPASVIKELVENALDAGASSIAVELLNGGIDYMAVIDDGDGITRDDLPLAISRHATSKIQSLEDLHNVASLGFRGEALASIASVAKLVITSQHESEEHAWQLQVEGSCEAELAPAALPKGTRIEVKQLFFNTPARRKFLKTARTEYLQIEALFDRLALCHYQVAFRLKHNDKVTRDYPVATTEAQRLARVGKVLGEAFCAHAMALDYSDDGMRLSGWAAEASYNRSTGDQQLIFINGRAVKDKVVAHAVRQAYQDVLFHGRQPAYVVYLDMAPNLVDVNVHPAKNEVRFRESVAVHQLVRRGIKQTLAKTAEELLLNRRMASENIITTATVHEAVPHNESPRETTIKAPIVEPMAQPKPIPVPTKTVSPQQSFVVEFADVVQPATISEVKQENLTQEPTLGTAVAQIHDIYILAQNKQGLVVVDMHAAHERVLYERLKSELAAGQIESQLLLIPQVVKVNPQSLHAFQQVKDNLEQLGMEIDQVAEDSLAIRSLPKILKSSQAEKLLLDILSDINTHDYSNRLQDRLLAILGNIACKAAKRAGDSLSLKEMDALLRDMEKTARSGLCNHGRPTVVEFSLAEMDKWFLRGQ